MCFSFSTKNILKSCCLWLLPMECIGWAWNQEKKLAGDHVIKGSALVNKKQRQEKYHKQPSLTLPNLQILACRLSAAAWPHCLHSAKVTQSVRAVNGVQWRCSGELKFTNSNLDSYLAAALWKSPPAAKSSWQAELTGPHLGSCCCENTATAPIVKLASMHWSHTAVIALLTSPYHTNVI